MNGEPDAVHGEPAQPRPLVLARTCHQWTHHAELREREREEHVDAVEDDQDVDSPLGVEAAPRAPAPPMIRMPFWVTSRSESWAKRVRHPRVDGHVGEHARAVEEAGLRGDEQQRRLREQRERARTPCPIWRPPTVQSAGQRVEERRVQRAAGLVLDAEQQVGEQDAAGGERQRDRHVAASCACRSRPSARAGSAGRCRPPRSRYRCRRRGCRRAEGRRAIAKKPSVPMLAARARRASPSRPAAARAHARDERADDDDRVRDRGRRGRSAPAAMTDSFTPRRFSTISAHDADHRGHELPWQPAAAGS